MLLDIEWKSVLQKPRYVLAVVTVSVTDREEMAVSEVEYVRVREVGVLIDLVGVVSGNATLRRERELCNYVVH